MIASWPTPPLAAAVAQFSGERPSWPRRAIGSAPASSSSRAVAASPGARSGSRKCQRDAHTACSGVHPVRGSRRAAAAGSRSTSSRTRSTSPRIRAVARLCSAISGVSASRRTARPVQSRTLATQKSAASCSRAAARASTSALRAGQLENPYDLATISCAADSVGRSETAASCAAAAASPDLAPRSRSLACCRSWSRLG